MIASPRSLFLGKLVLILSIQEREAAWFRREIGPKLDALKLSRNARTASEALGSLAQLRAHLCMFKDDSQE